MMDSILSVSTNPHVVMATERKGDGELGQMPTGINLCKDV